MERELLMTGIGGQGVQLAAQVVARAALTEGREVQLFGSYGGMMRGGATESTVVVADRPIEAPPTVETAWSVVFMHHEHADHARQCLAPGSVAFVNTSVVPVGSATGGHTVVEVPASDLALEVGHVMTASMVMIGAYAAVTGMVRLSSLVRASEASLPSYRSQHVALNDRALRAGFDAVEEGLWPAWPDRAAVAS
jgi:2-oxoacid:acceptor oxidoreductase gamma subunit (pyruvate/2-ketoisovalerate family)